MKHANRITVQARRCAFRLPAIGWLTVYTLASVLAGAMAYLMGAR